jgi:hypothetical protein
LNISNFKIIFLSTINDLLMFLKTTALQINDLQGCINYLVPRLAFEIIKT